MIVPPEGLDGFDVARILPLLDGGRTRDDVLVEATGYGIDPLATGALLDSLTAAGTLRRTGPAVSSADVAAHRIHIYGNGPLTDVLCTHFAQRDIRWSKTVRYHSGEGFRPDIGCVVLADRQVPDPGLVKDLVQEKIPHLAVCTRDGRGVVGPFVFPGRTSCLRCADLFRTDIDPVWPRLAAQLWTRPSYADPATVLATAAHALAQLEPILSGTFDRPPALANRTVEIDLTSHRTVTRTWPRHPDCECRSACAPVQA